MREFKSIEKNLGFIEYSTPDKYSEIFAKNLAAVKRLRDIPEFAELIRYLSDKSGLSEAVVALSVKRYVMTVLEYYPEKLRFGSFHFLGSVIKLIKSAVFGITWKNKLKRKDVIIDLYYKIAFYSEAMIRMLNNGCEVELIDIQRQNKIYYKDFFSFLPKLLRGLRPLKMAEKSCGLPLHRYYVNFFLGVMRGKTLSRRYAPKVVISGNDNGVDSIMVKSAGAQLCLIQNGARPYMSDSTFGYADMYFGHGSEYFAERFKEIGWHISKYYSFGSLSLYRNLEAKPRLRNADKYDILWATSWDLCFKRDLFVHYYNCMFERQAVALLNRYAAKSNLKIAYQCRFKDDLKKLKKTGLYSDNIKYIESKDQLVYSSIFQADITLSSSSTVCHEAMLAGKRSGFVNLSGNRNMNEAFRSIDIEETEDSEEALDLFIRKIKSLDSVVFQEFGKQNNNYIVEFVGIILKQVERWPVPICGVPGGGDRNGGTKI